MIVCPNCKHENPQGATNCEACYTALPATRACPNCGASMQLDATFCGQCGHNLKSAESKSPLLQQPPAVAQIDPPPAAANQLDLPPTILTEPAADLFASPSAPIVTPSSETSAPPISEPAVNVAPTVATVAVEVPPVPTPEPPPAIEQLPLSHQLVHLQTNTILEIPPHLQVIHVGKPNETIAPDIDVSSFPCAEVVSRIHANIQVEDNNYYIEDAGSANGTYINHNVLAKGNRHLLRTGDRIGLGKGDLVTLIFQ
jgi:ribosomal protein L40E